MNPDFRDLLHEFNAHEVEFLVVGAHALAAHGHVRATKDLDVWVRPHPANAERVRSALGVFGAPIADLTITDLSTPGTIFQIGSDTHRRDYCHRRCGVRPGLECSCSHTIRGRICSSFVARASHSEQEGCRQGAGLAGRKMARSSSSGLGPPN